MLRPDLVADPAVTRAAIAVAVQAGVPVVIWGRPGEGKTRMVESVGRALGRHTETVIGSIREASDFGGLPERSAEGVVLHAPKWAHRAAAADRALVFLDELTTATPPVQAAMLRVVLDREVGDLTLPDSVAIVAAANPADIAADGYDLAAPLANRFCHLWHEAQLASWTQGMTSNWPDDTVSCLQSDPLARHAKWVGLVTSFLRSRPNMFHVESDARYLGGPWPSPRTWDMVIRLGATADTVDAVDDVMWALTAGCVGEGAAIELLAFRQQLDLPDPETILAGDTGLDPSWRLDQVHAALTATAAAVATQRTRQRWERGLELAEAAAIEFGDDVGAVVAADLLRLRDPSWPLPGTLRRFRRVLDAVGA